MNPCLAVVLLVLALAMPVVAQPVVDPTDLDLDGMPGIAAPFENLSSPPAALVGSGTLLIDHSHHGTQAFNVSGFTDYLASNGWTISVLSIGPITEGVLDSIDVLLIPCRVGFGPILPFSASEVIAIQAFLSDGKGLWVLNDNEPTGVNTLSSAFGVTFLLDEVRDPSNNEGELFWPTIHVLTEHPVTSGVESYGYYSGDCIEVGSPASVIARGDEDSYSFFCAVGTYPPTLAIWENVGRAVFAGDITPLHPSYYVPRLRAEEQLLLQNIANWLLGDKSTSTSAPSWGSVKAGFQIERRESP